LITFANIVSNYLFFTFFRCKPDKAMEECTQRSSVTASFKQRWLAAGQWWDRFEC